MSEQKIKNACERFWKKDQKKYISSKRKNNKPEEPVVQEHLEFFHKNDWFMNRYESKAVRRFGGRFDTTGSVVVGHPDIGGCSPHGIAAFPEIKAPGKRSNVSRGQYSFLSSVIQRGGFGIVTDSLSYTLQTYNHFIKLNTMERIKFLMNELPVPREMKNQDECPF